MRRLRFILMESNQQRHLSVFVWRHTCICCVCHLKKTFLDAVMPLDVNGFCLKIKVGCQWLRKLKSLYGFLGIPVRK